MQNVISPFHTSPIHPPTTSAPAPEAGLVAAADSFVPSSNEAGLGTWKTLGLVALTGLAVAGTAGAMVAPSTAPHVQASVSIQLPTRPGVQQAAATGDIGGRALSAVLSQSVEQVSLNGSLGNSAVQLQQEVHGNSSRIFGTVNDGLENVAVDVTVTSSGDSRTFTGTVGRNQVDLRETTLGQSSLIEGTIGTRMIHVTRTRFGNAARFTGTITEMGGPWGTVDVTVQSNRRTAPNANYDSIVPLFGVSGFPFGWPAPRGGGVIV